MNKRTGTDVKIALCAGLGITAIAVIVTLVHAPTTVAGTNSISSIETLGVTHRDTSLCQGNETLPEATSAIRLGLVAPIDPAVTVTARTASHQITHGAAEAGWHGAELTIPVTPTHRTYSHVTVCAHIGFPIGKVRVVGKSTTPALAAVWNGEEALVGRMKIEYLRAGSESWWSRVPTIVRHLGFGRAFPGSWIAIPMLALAATAVMLASWGILREMR